MENVPDGRWALTGYPLLEIPGTSVDHCTVRLDLTDNAVRNP